MKDTKILVIDDHLGTTQFVAAALKKNGFTVLQANSGFSGIETAEREHPDIIILDILMPDIKGSEVLDELKKRGIPARVIMLSAAENPTETAIEYVKLGACDYMSKPVRVDNMLDKIHRAMILESTIMSRRPALFDNIINQLEMLYKKHEELQKSHDELHRKYKDLFVVKDEKFRQKYDKVQSKLEDYFRAKDEEQQRAFTDLLSKYEELEEKYNELKQNFETLQSEHKTLQMVNNELLTKNKISPK